MKNSALLSFFLFFLNFSFAQQIDLQPIATGFSAPLNIQNCGDDRLFIVEQGGIIKIIENNNILSTPFLDISNQVSSSGERGLLGLAFHPDYTTNGRFFVYYSDNNGDSVLSEFEVSNDENIADATSETVLLNIPQPFSNHNGGCIAFGPDGMLYVASGDGGSGGDPNNNAQNLNSLLGKLLRLDLDNSAPYIPSDNPYANDASALDEIWAYGLRNAWKFSFDSTTGNIWIADVGQNAIEEINNTTNTAGLNYGWRCYEGSTVYNNSGNCPPTNDLVFPFAEYTHNSSGVSKCSVTGGFVYRGSEFPNLLGKYVFADFCSDEIGLIDSSGNITYFGPFSGNNFSSFGIDHQNNLYVAGISSGTIYKVNDSSLSIEDFSKNSVTIFPNPSEENMINFTSEEIIQQIEIFSLQGQLLQQKKVQQTEGNIELQTLSAGIYLVKLINLNEQATVKRLIIQ